MLLKKKAPIAKPDDEGQDKKAQTDFLVCCRVWLGKHLRRLARHYTQAVNRAWNRLESAKLDAIIFLLESEESEGVES